MQQQSGCLLIHSVAEGGRRFRPSDWIERISSGVARFGSDRRLRYNTLVHPIIVNEEKCLYVSEALAQQDPQLYTHIMEFARINRLEIDSGGCERRAA